MTKTTAARETSARTSKDVHVRERLGTPPDLKSEAIATLKMKLVERQI